jgi:TolB-like protein/DNA-binding winged helix-turn-helix (wHTH) protein/Tfp pilus assembly protein PilF
LPVTVYQFGDFTLSCGKSELSRRGRRLKIERKPLELLTLLVSRHGEVVTRDEISRHLWEEEVFVDVEHGINTAIRKIRQTLGDSPDLPRFIETISGSGYRFIATVAATDSEVGEPVPAHGLSIELPQSLSGDTVTLDAPAATVQPADRRRRWFWPVAASCAAILVAASIAAPGFRARSTFFPHRNSRAAIGSIAVLPLQNLSNDPAQQYFADGMTDELITELARVPKLRVVSRTSVMASKDSVSSLPDIARRLNVDAVVEGSIMRSGDRVRITAQLIDARSDRHLWAQSFESSASDVLAIQDSVAQQIAAQASFVLAPPSPQPPVNPAAYDAYLLGRYFFHKQHYSQSLESFKHAVALDPNYASAHAGYASALEAATTVNIGTPQQLMPTASKSARRAIELDPENGEAYTLLGSVETIYDWDWNAAEQNLSRGISLSPNDSIAEFKYAVYLDAIGRTQDAVTHMRRALQLDPLSFLMNLRLGVALYYDRQYDAALAQMERASEMERGSGSVEYYLSFIYEQMGKRDEAVQHSLAAMRVIQPQINNTALLNEYRQHGWETYWRSFNHALDTSAAFPCMAYTIGIDDLRLAEYSHAFDSFAQAAGRHCFSMAFIRVDPVFDPVRHDPRYVALLARMHQQASNFSSVDERVRHP